VFCFNSLFDFHGDLNGAEAAANGVPYSDDKVVLSFGKIELLVEAKVGARSFA
jgi:hypothetical protein